MKALLKTGKDKAEVREIEKPGDKTVVKTLRVGIDGTDREVLESGMEVAPGENMILGHEALGRVENSSEIEEGTLVVPTVRRSSDTCPPRFRDRADFCAPGSYVERGIYRAHGYCSEYFAEDAKHLVPVPEENEEFGVLVEPTSIVVKALDQAFRAQERLDYQPSSALILGAGAIGLLASMVLRRKGIEVTAVDIVDTGHPKTMILEEIGAEYVENREKALDELGSFDLILESSGVSKQLFDSIPLLDARGALVSVGLPRDREETAKIEIGRIHEEMVLKNKIFVGSVNSSRPHFEEAADHIQFFRENFPVEQMLDVQVSLEDWEKAFDPDIKGEIIFEQ